MLAYERDTNNRRHLPLLLLMPFLLCVFSLLSCQDKGSSQPREAQENASPLFTSASDLVTHDGIYFLDPQSFLLHFYDFEQEQTVVVCQRPNCEHKKVKDTGHLQKNEVCQADLGNRSMILASYRQKLYAVKEIPAKKDIKIQLVVSDLDRSNQKDLGSPIDGQIASELIFSGNQAFLSVINIDFEGQQMSSDQYSLKEEGSIYSFDLDTGNHSQVYTTGLSYGVKLNLLGIKDRDLFYRSEFTKENPYLLDDKGLPYLAYSDPSQVNLTIGYLSLDTLKLGQLDLTPIHAFPETGSFIFDDKIYFTVNKNFKDYTSYGLYRYDDQEEKLAPLFETRRIKCHWNNLILYEDDQSGLLYLYDLKSDLGQPYGVRKLDDLDAYFFCFQDYSSDISYLMYRDDGPKEGDFRFMPRAIRKKDFINADLSKLINLD